MIIQSTRISRASGVERLEAHLLDKHDDNEAIEIIAGDRGALHDAQSYANLKRCTYSLRHLSVSPQLDMTPGQLADFLTMVEAEFRVGPDRPRLVVRHIKQGRQHFHVVIGEVDPATSRILDCRKDFERLESLARAYERKHSETVLADRRSRRENGREGLSQLGRKRAERVAPDFDRSKLRTAFAAGMVSFAAEMSEQGLHLGRGRKCLILVNADGAFVAAAHRACGAKPAEFLRALSAKNERVRPATVRPSNHGAPIRPLTRREIWHLATGKVDYDDLLRRALEFAESMGAIFESGAKRQKSGAFEARHSSRTKTVELKGPSP